MDKEDARYQKLEQLHERRKQVVRLYRRGHGVMAIVDLTGLSYPAVRRAIDLYESGGVAALKPASRGRTPGQGRRLSAEQEALVRRTICDKRPEQLKMDFALWTRAAVMQLIEQLCGVKLSVRAMGNYLKRWGFTRQKPVRHAYEQRPKAKGAEIQWGDETFAPHGKAPVTRAVGGTREKLSMISPSPTKAAPIG